MKKLILLIALAVVMIMPGCGLFGSANYAPPITTFLTSSTPSYSTTATPSHPDTEMPTPNMPVGFLQENPVPLGQAAINADGIQITVLGYLSGQQAWAIIKGANAANVAPEAGKEYVIITYRIKNVSSHGEPYIFYYSYFDLVNNAGRVFNTYEKYVTLPSNGIFNELQTELNHGDEASGAVHFYVPQGETGLTLVWSDFYGYNKLYFAI